MKKLITLSLVAAFSLAAASAFAQSVTVNTDKVAGPVGTNTITINVDRGTGWPSGTYSWTLLDANNNAVPASNYSFSGSVNTNPRVLTLNAGLSPIANADSLFRVQVTRGTTTKTVDIHVRRTNFWAALGATASTAKVEAFDITGGVYTAGPTKIFDVGVEFAALGRGPYPSVPQGYYYYIPNTSFSNNGQFTMYAVSGTGGTPVPVLTYDVNGSSNSTGLSFVRLALDKFGTAWILSGTAAGTLYLVSVPTLGTSSISSSSVTVVDADVALSGGSPTSFQNGDICLDGNGNLYVLANSGGTTELYIGQPNGANTVLTKRWNVLNENSQPFNGSVNGNAFDEFGGMYLTTNGNSNGVTDGIYYLSPSTISNSGTSVSTINVALVYTGSGYTDLGTNIWPMFTPLPVKITTVSASLENGRALVKWEAQSERDLDNYEVQMSTDGANFETMNITKPYSSNVDRKNYQVSFDVQKSSDKYFFRIKANDFDGHIDYSRVVAVKTSAKAADQMRIYPNPVKDICYMEVAAIAKGAIQVQVINALGKTMISDEIGVQNGNNVIDLGTLVEKLPAGLYTVSVTVDGQTTTQKMIKY